jgi:hypothetical protein
MATSYNFPIGALADVLETGIDHHITYQVKMAVTSRKHQFGLYIQLQVY